MKKQDIKLSKCCKAPIVYGGKVDNFGYPIRGLITFCWKCKKTIKEIKKPKNKLEKDLLNY